MLNLKSPNKAKSHWNKPSFEATEYTPPKSKFVFNLTLN